MGEEVVMIGRLGPSDELDGCSSMSLTPLRDRAALRKWPNKESQGVPRRLYHQADVRLGFRGQATPFPK